jgi:hypothetical protein
LTAVEEVLGHRKEVLLQLLASAKDGVGDIVQELNSRAGVGRECRWTEYCSPGRKRWWQVIKGILQLLNSRIDLHAGVSYFIGGG